MHIRGSATIRVTAMLKRKEGYTRSRYNKDTISGKTIKQAVARRTYPSKFKMMHQFNLVSALCQYIVDISHLQNRAENNNGIMQLYDGLSIGDTRLSLVGDTGDQYTFAEFDLA